ncbi:MAG: hypothetical protein ACXADC_04860 [Candidatus Thorarchaeota archaeon]|jgi:hypothetical protein
MSRSISYPLSNICLVLILLVASPVEVYGNPSNSSVKGLQDISSQPVNVTEWRLQITEMNGRFDLMVDILYSYNFTEDERLTTASLFLSLDNESFIQAQKHEFDPELLPAIGTGGFFFANAVGDPLPFDVYEGDILYGYVVFTTTTDTYTSPRVAHEIPIDVIRPLLFRIPPILFYIGGIVAGVLPLIIIVYCVTRKRNR